MTAERNYWVDLFTWSTWQEFLCHGGNVSGFRGTSVGVVKQIAPGDHPICYVVRLGRWIKAHAKFDEATYKTVDMIDAIWLKSNAIVAAFEVERRTPIYSGLLRMSDLIVMQPNLNMALFPVAPDERREKVLSEVNSPTFSRLNSSLNGLCHFIPFSAIRKQIPKLGPGVVCHVSPIYVSEELSEFAF